MMLAYQRVIVQPARVGVRALELALRMRQALCRSQRARLRSLRVAPRLRQRRLCLRCARGRSRALLQLCTLLLRILQATHRNGIITMNGDPKRYSYTHQNVWDINFFI